MASLLQFLKILDPFWSGLNSLYIYAKVMIISLYIIKYVYIINIDKQVREYKQRNGACRAGGHNERFVVDAAPNLFSDGILRT